MSVASIMEYLSHYGLLFIFIIIFLESLNLPGLASGVIVPLAGAWIYDSGNSLILAIIIAMAAGIAASWILYLIGRLGGNFVIDKYERRFPKHKQVIDKCISKLKRHGNVGVFVCTLLPAVRTIIPVPAGLLKLNFLRYTICSGLGILIWNGALMIAGYYGISFIMQGII